MSDPCPPCGLCDSAEKPPGGYLKECAEPSNISAGTALEIDETLLERFGGRAPRYTSYPTADRFHGEIKSGEFAAALRKRGRQHPSQPLGLYVHIPFCRTICWYCACNKIGTKHPEQSTPYLQALRTEINRTADLLGRRQRVTHLHFGGGTPTFMPDNELAELLGQLRERFDFADDAQGEYSIEVDPRTVDAARMQRLRDLGFNRVSLGVQDFDPEVQRAVNRIQPWQRTLALIEAGRAASFRSINVDLIYGLPRQTVASLQGTVERTLQMRPDRIALYHYAHLPRLFKPQRRIHDCELAAAADKARMFQLAVRLFESAGYRHLGLDHFAREGDELAVAQREGRLHRNFQGYCSHDSGDLIAFGVSAISSVGGLYAQNDRTLAGWLARLSAGECPVVRGIELDADDVLRRDLIQSLMCEFRVDRVALHKRFGSAVDSCFEQALPRLRELAEAGAIQLSAAGLEVLPRGRLLVRAVAMAFDRHLADLPTEAYSKIA